MNKKWYWRIQYFFVCAEIEMRDLSKIISNATRRVPLKLKCYYSKGNDRKRMRRAMMYKNKRKVLE